MQIKSSNLLANNHLVCSSYMNQACQHWHPGFHRHHGTARQPRAQGSCLCKAHWQVARMRDPSLFLPHVTFSRNHMIFKKLAEMKWNKRNDSFQIVGFKPCEMDKYRQIEELASRQETLSCQSAFDCCAYDLGFFCINYL